MTHSRRAAPSAVTVLPLSFAGDDAALVAAIREGRPGAKAEFFNRYANQVERLVTHVIGFDPELADILQETYTIAFASIHSLKQGSALKPWLFGIATRTARKLLRTRSRRRWLRYFIDEEDEARHEPLIGPTDTEAVHTLRAVYAILARLSVDERVAFSLRFVEGMELEEVAATSGVSLATTKRRLRRAQDRFLRAARKDAMLVERLERGGRWPRTR
ncbi:MAG TPA: RNA polymerase sigma factor [Polyangiaceae bacterium]|nr:RNA polymerase sigma factor [Polyangiaceae bacterium]